jgi:hypothetical protein
MEISRLTSRPELYTSEKESRRPCNRRLGGPKSRFGPLREKSLAPTEIRTPDRSASRAVATAAALSRDTFDGLSC